MAPAHSAAPSAATRWPDAPDASQAAPPGCGGIDIMTLPIAKASARRAGTLPIPPYGALVPPNAPSSHELTDPSFCSLAAKRCALVLRAALPFDEFLEQRLLLIEAMTKFCGTAALATTPALAAIGLAVMAERCASQDPASGVRLRPGSVAVRLTSRHFGCRSEACSSAKRGNSVSTKRAMRAAAPGSSLSLAAESTMPVATVCISPLPSIRLG